ncbi:MAG TPA: FHA domain-containing protein [Aggregatilineales bacterium]|nr:FHA domain-containing protein [Aggregatilineales bacterium]
MIPVTVTIQFMRAGAKETQRVKLALDVPARQLVQQLLRDFRLPIEQNGTPVRYHLLRQRQVLDGDASLFDAGVQENDILQLTVFDPAATLGQSLSGTLLNRLGGRAGVDPLPISAALLHLNGEVFSQLHHTRALIGRADASIGYPPEALDADLTCLDPNRTVSRPHALIVYNNGEFAIRDLYSPAGVFINGARISPSKPEPLRSGALLQFGEVQLRFWCAS